MSGIESSTSPIVNSAKAAVFDKTKQLTYRTARRFVEAQYWKAYRARITCDYPTLMAVCDINRQPLSVAGIRSPLQPFYLEHYLDRRAEQVLSDHFGRPIKREKIVEIGNLAGGKDRVATTYLMHQLWDYLIRCGFEYVVLTGTATLLHKFRRLPFHQLKQASADQVPHASSWGSYYRQSPSVVAGRLADYDFRFYRDKQIAGYQFDVLTAGGDL